MAEDNLGDVIDPFEAKLKTILEYTVNLVKPRLKTKSQLAKLQDRLVDYHSNEELVEMIEDVLKILGQVLPKAKGSIQQEKAMVQQEQYIKLEQSLQIYEAKVRAHIKNEHQLKLYCDELETKNKELQQSKHDLVMSTKTTILQLKRDNEDLVAQLRKYKNKDILDSSENRYSTTPHERKNKVESNNENSQNRVTGKNHYKNPLIDLRQSSKKKLMALEHLDLESKKKYDQYSSMGPSFDASRSRKGSVSSLKIRDKK